MDLLPDLWRQEYWLPPGVTWEDLEQLPDSERPRPKELLIALPLALGFVAVRCVFERYSTSELNAQDMCGVSVSKDGLHGEIFHLGGFWPPIARSLGVKNRFQSTAAPSSQLESFYTHRSKQPTQLEVFFYLSAFIAGLTSLINRPWFWDQRECWRNYPFQPLERAHFWYYMLELGFYGSLLLRISVDVKRKDFKEQVIHHLATIFLLCFSYCANYIRIGTLVMLLHDSSDILLESAKMFNYGAGWRKTCDSLFVVFAVVFLVTRLVIFPSRVIHTTLLLSMEVFEPFAGYYFFNVLLMVLQALHIFWAGLIIRMVCKFFKGKLEKTSAVMKRVTPRWKRKTKLKKKRWIKEEIVTGKK